jgi:hypothetical protein
MATIKSMMSRLAASILKAAAKVLVVGSVHCSLNFSKTSAKLTFCSKCAMTAWPGRLRLCNVVIASSKAGWDADLSVLMALRARTVVVFGKKNNAEGRIAMFFSLFQ